jgi:hypothetical protein
MAAHVVARDRARPRTTMAYPSPPVPGLPVVLREAMMAPPDDEAIDKLEGFCEECCDWVAWSDLHPCVACDGHYCEDHHGTHDCDGAR